MSGKTEQTYSIGKLAEAAFVNVETIRFYERKGIIKQPQKGTGTRKYSTEHLKRISFTKRAQELGFSLDEIKSLLELKVSRVATCSQVKAKTDQKLLEVKEKIKDLKKIEKALLRMSDSCSSKEKSTTDCPILEELEFGKRN